MYTATIRVPHLVKPLLLGIIRTTKFMKPFASIERRDWFTLPRNIEIIKEQEENDHTLMTFTSPEDSSMNNQTFEAMMNGLVHGIHWGKSFGQ